MDASIKLTYVLKSNRTRSKLDQHFGKNRTELELRWKKHRTRTEPNPSMWRTRTEPSDPCSGWVRQIWFF